MLLNPVDYMGIEDIFREIDSMKLEINRIK